MNTRRVLVAPGLAAALAILSAHLTAQAIERSMYVSVVNEAGAPVPGLGPADFVVREDNVAREVLRVVPAREPMQIAVLIDTSRVARDNVTYMRTALPPFVTALVNSN